jgi:hypothetical protein
MRVGLVLGKFAPLHKGHQFLIEQALGQVDRLLVMVYACPDLIDVPLSRRAGWIRNLYPGVTVIEAPDGPLEVGDSPEIKKRHEDYILFSLGGHWELRIAGLMNPVWLYRYPRQRSGRITMSIAIGCIPWFILI